MPLGTRNGNLLKGKTGGLVNECPESIITAQGFLDWDCYRGIGTATTKIITLANAGAKGCNWTATLTLDAGITGTISLDSSTGTLTACGAGSISVTFNPALTTIVGEFVGNVHIENDEDATDYDDVGITVTVAEYSAAAKTAKIRVYCRTFRRASVDDPWVESFPNTFVNTTINNAWSAFLGPTPVDPHWFGSGSVPPSHAVAVYPDLTIEWYRQSGAYQLVANGSVVIDDDGFISGTLINPMYMVNEKAYEYLTLIVGSLAY